MKYSCWVVALGILFVSAIPVRADQDQCTLEEPPAILDPVRHKPIEFKVEPHSRVEKTVLSDGTRAEFDWGGCSDRLDQTIILQRKKAGLSYQDTDKLLAWAVAELKLIRFSDMGKMDEIIALPASKLTGKKFMLKREARSAYLGLCRDPTQLDHVTQKEMCEPDAPEHYEVTFQEDGDDLIITFGYSQWV